MRPRSHRPSQDVHDHWQVNICLPVHVNEHELTYLLPHVKAGAQRAYEDYDLITVGSIIDDDDGSTSEASANKVEHGSPRRAKDRVTCQLGVLVTTPHVCLQMKRVAAHRDVNFVCFDSDILTTTMFGGHLDPNGISDCSSGKSGACACNAAKFSTHCTCYFGTSGHGLIRENLMKEYHHRSILSYDPYFSFNDATESVPWLLKRSVSDIHSISRYNHHEVSVMVLGRQTASLDYLRFLHDLHVDAVGCRVEYLPCSLFGCANVASEEHSHHAQSQLTGDLSRTPRPGVLQKAGEHYLMYGEGYNAVLLHSEIYLKRRKI